MYMSSHSMDLHFSSFLPPRCLCESPPRCLCESPPRCLCESPPRCLCESPPRCLCESPPRCLCESPPRCLCEGCAANTQHYLASEVTLCDICNYSDQCCLYSNQCCNYSDQCCLYSDQCCLYSDQSVDSSNIRSAIYGPDCDSYIWQWCIVGLQWPSASHYVSGRHCHYTGRHCHKLIRCRPVLRSQCLIARCIKTLV